MVGNLDWSGAPAFKGKYDMVDSKSTIVVTGGCGFIGSNFLHLLAKSHIGTVVVFDQLTYAGRHENLYENHLPGQVFWRGNISSYCEVDEVFQRFRPDFIVNFAAESHVDRSIVGSTDFIQSNVVGVQILLDACLRYGVKRFLQVGTDEVYGDLADSQDDDDYEDKLEILEEKRSSQETDVLRPSSPYSAAKAAADLLALSYVRTHGLDVVVTRGSNNYGPRQFPEKLIPLMILNAIEDKPLPVYGNGRQIRDWIHVDDYCNGILQVLRKGEKGEVYNLGADNQTQNIWIVKRILEILGKPESLIEHVEDRKGHDVRYSLDSSKALDKLNWSAFVGVESGLETTVQWYQVNEDWWMPLRKR